MTTLNLQIVNTFDDSYENSSGTVSNSQSVADATNEFIGLRFQYVLIPPGSTINSAVLSMMPTDSGKDEPNHPIHGFDEDFTPLLINALGSFSTRPLTTATVTWSSTDLGADGSTFYSPPAVTAIVQEIVDRAGWLPGNALGFRIQGSASSTRDLKIVDYGVTPANAAKLDIDFTAGDRLFEIIRPAATGLYSNLGNSGGGAHYESVDEIYPDSTDALFRSNGAAYSDWRVNSALSSETIVAVNSVFIGYKSIAGGLGDGQTRVTFDDSTYTSGTLRNLTAAGQVPYIDYALSRPGGGSWAPADLKNATGGAYFGMEMTGDASTTAYVIQWYLVVEYEEADGGQEESGAGSVEVEAEAEATGSKHGAGDGATSVIAGPAGTGAKQGSGAGNIEAEALSEASGTGAHAGDGVASAIITPSSAGSSLRAGSADMEAVATVAATGQKVAAASGEASATALVEAAGVAHRMAAASLTAVIAPTAEGSSARAGVGAVEAIAAPEGSGSGSAPGMGAVEVVAVVAATGVSHRSGSATVESLAEVEAESASVGSGDGAIACEATVVASGVAHRRGVATAEVECLAAGNGAAHKLSAALVMVSVAVSVAGSTHRVGMAAIAAMASLVAENAAPFVSTVSLEGERDNEIAIDGVKAEGIGLTGRRSSAVLLEGDRR